VKVELEDDADLSSAALIGTYCCWLLTFLLDHILSSEHQQQKVTFAVQCMHNDNCVVHCVVPQHCKHTISDLCHHGDLILQP
jgi:hypothetical protein